MKIKVKLILSAALAAALMVLPQRAGGDCRRFNECNVGGQRTPMPILTRR